MFITFKHLLVLYHNIFISVSIALFFIAVIIIFIYGYKKYKIEGLYIYNDPSVYFMIFTALTEAVFYYMIKAFPELKVFGARIDSYAFSVWLNLSEAFIFLPGVIISLFNEKYYAEKYPVTVYRISAFVILSSVLFIIIEIRYILLIMICAALLILIGVLSALKINIKK